TAVFAVHPLLSEAINYVHARTSLQAAALMLLSFWLYVRGRETGRRDLLAAASVALLLAMGTKILAMTLPVLFVSWEALLGPSRHHLRADGARAWVGRLGPPFVIAFGFT